MQTAKRWKVVCSHLLLLFLLVAGAFPTHADDGVPMPAVDARESVFRIFCMLEEGIASGTGFVVGQDEEGTYIATNYHVVSEAQEEDILLISHNGDEVTARVIEYQPDVDICFMKTSEPIPGAQPLPLAQEDPLVGSAVYAIGFPGAGDYLMDEMAYHYEDTTITNGIVSALRKRTVGTQKVTYLQMNVAINPGNSGGPLVNGEGTVVGINTFIVTADDAVDMFVAVSTQHLTQLLQQCGVAYVNPEQEQTGNTSPEQAESNPNISLPTEQNQQGLQAGWLVLTGFAGCAAIVGAALLLRAWKRPGGYLSRNSVAQGCNIPQQEATTLQKQAPQTAAVEQRGQSAQTEQNEAGLTKGKAIVVCCVALVSSTMIIGWAINEVNYRKAGASLSQGDFYGGYQAIASVFPGYRESEELKQYALAGTLMEHGDYEGGKKLFLQLHGRWSAEVLAKECDYRQAQALMENGELEQAKELFTALSGYRQADDWLLECDYRHAVALLKAKNYSEARKWFAQLGAKDYRDAAQLLTEATYRQGMDAYEKQDYVTALRVMGMLGSYFEAKDWYEKSKNKVYQIAKNDMEEGTRQSCQRAAWYFRMLPGYQDADIYLQKLAGYSW